MKNTLSRSVAVSALIGVGAAAAFAGVSLHDRRQVPAGTSMPGLAELPETLRETGFDTLARIPFTPQYPLWSDGATKQRWIHLPDNTAIDASNPDAWQFPVGTRVWKEFSFRGARVETRYMQLTPAGWQYATYVWNADDSIATRAPVRGASSVEVAPGVSHKIPSEADCRACHASSASPVLAFSALQLSPDRDPNAPHAEALSPGSAVLPELVADGLVVNLPPHLLFAPPRIPGPPVERAALGYLHANCGGCHRTDATLGSVGMELAYRLGAPGGAQRTAVDIASHFEPSKSRIASGSHEGSVLYKRMSARTPTEQMPPLGSQLVDTEATRLIADWIDQLPH